MSEDAHNLVCCRCGGERLPSHAYCRDCKQKADRLYRKRRTHELNVLRSRQKGLTRVTLDGNAGMGQGND